MSQDGSAGRDLIQVGRDYIRKIKVNIASGKWLNVGLSLLSIMVALGVAGTGVKLTVEHVIPPIISKISEDSETQTQPRDPSSISTNQLTTVLEEASQDESQIQKTPGIEKTDESQIAANVKRLQERKNCRKCDLSGVDLRGADLVGADLREANLSRANLADASLKDAKLNKAILEGANLQDTELIDSNLSNAQLKGAYLRLANLRRANLSNANLRGADLSRADLITTDLTNSNLWDAGLRGANLRGANLSGGDLKGAHFGWYYNPTNFSNAKLIRANLSDTQIGDSKFTGANLSGADLRVTDKDNKWFEGWEGINLCGAKMPDGTESRKGC